MENLRRTPLLGALLTAYTLCLPDVVFSEALETRQRIAVVVGNGNYSNLPKLDNPESDARLVSRLFEDAGFQVELNIDLTRQGFEELIKRLSFEVDENSEVIFYFAGHGFQVGSKNFLVPVDSLIDDKNDIPFQSVSLERLIQVVSSRSQLQMFLLDSCRDNPFEHEDVVVGAFSQIQRISSGFSFQVAPINSLISFATAPGAVAYDGEGDNSPYSSALVEIARSEPRQEITALLSKVRQTVFESTGGKQVPWESSSLITPVRLFDNVAEFSNANITESEINQLRVSEASASAIADSDEVENTQRITTKASREVPLGGIFDINSDASGKKLLTIETKPKYGALVAIRADESLDNGSAELEISLGNGDHFRYSELSSLLYRPDVLSLSRLRSNDVFFDSFTIDNGGTILKVEIELKIDECDLMAGGVLDSQGIGIEVHTQDLDPNLAHKACAVAVESFPNVPRFQYQLGRALEALNRPVEAELAYSKALAMGHYRGALALGLLKQRSKNRAGGFFRSKASMDVLELFSEGVEAGDVLASYSLGRQLLRYSDLKAEQEYGYQLLLDAFDVGYRQALNELGLFHITEGKGGFDPHRGKRYFQEAALRNDSYGHLNLGLVYRLGLGGLEKNVGKAVEHLEEASRLGNPIAPTHLGRIFDGGDGIEPDFDLAMQWYDLGLARGDPWAGSNGAWIILNKFPSNLGPYDAAARAAKAAVLANKKASDQARALLDELPADVLHGGTQTILNEMGSELVVDGNFGSTSLREFDVLVTDFDRRGTETSALERLIAAAEAYYRDQSFRTDLY